ncbi:hypothetical protein GQ55_9G427200 [Panicum hallii var. hallii]|uniref:Replication factor A C-terminal domain-containing protein n=1 Tax=Panicum hallii var. hallii TaxID=1504633 RepID=A0A2T7CAW4_9POAL|nr:hypothetical protein GQ55_9G427200 [Panicum hallii var. hallii]
MAFYFIPDLHPQNKFSEIRVSVGNAIYAEIPASEIERHNSKIEEHGVYMLSRFKVTNLKNSFRPVHAPFMIEFTCHTRINVVTNPPLTFPKYIYNLTDFEDLYSYIGDRTYFLDILAIITEVAEPQWRPISTQPKPAFTRDVTLQSIDLSFYVFSGSEMKLTLWGQRAREFNINSVYDAESAKPIVTLFVGCLMKTFMPTLERKSLQELNSMDPYDFSRTCYQCTVTISRLANNMIWWLKLAFIATDGTAESEMICFGNVAAHIVGKSAEYVMASARQGGNIPPDIAAIVSEKFTFSINMTENSYHTANKTYIINSVITAHGKQRSAL